MTLENSGRHCERGFEDMWREIGVGLSADMKDVMRTVWHIAYFDRASVERIVLQEVEEQFAPDLNGSATSVVAAIRARLWPPCRDENKQPPAAR